MILNLTQHPATPEQRDAGVIDLTNGDLEQLFRLLTFDALPAQRDILARAEQIAALASRHGAELAMIGGAPYLMAPLERALRGLGIQAVYAFSVRESVEQVQPDGSIRKTAIFRHGGFVPAWGE